MGDRLKVATVHSTLTDSSYLLTTGVGLYCQDLANVEAPRPDFHEPDRLIQDLDPYDHLRRFLSLCTTHFFRNIRKCSVPEEVRNSMRSLVCTEHPDWDATIAEITTVGGKPALSESRCIAPS